jgi:ABC-type bacteriocin/lantibiotic exporter with double-glycine peptidase domain
MKPVAIKVIMQNTGADCAVAALAMGLGRPYEAVSDALPQRSAAMRHGLSVKQIINVAKRLGRTLRRVKFNEDEHSGILSLTQRDTGLGHVVLYVEGVIINPADGVVWLDVGTYLRTGDWSIDCILVER